MRLLFAAVAALLLPAATLPPDPVSTGEAIRAHVATLADDNMEGRDAGTAGYDRAAAYVVDQYRAMGLAPGAGADWLQPVLLRDATIAEDPAPRVTIGGVPFAHGGTVQIAPGATAGARSFSGQAVFVGYGLDAPEAGYDDYRGLDVSGKIIVYLTGAPRGIDPDIAGLLVARRPAMAAARGARGMIAIQTRASARARPWEGALTAATPSHFWIGPDGASNDPSTGLAVTMLADRSAAAALFAGAKRPLDKILAEADRRGRRPRGFPLLPEVTIDASVTTRDLRSANVLAVLPGSDPALASEYVLVLAHLDHVGIDANATEDKIRNGAMDNGVGVGTMIEVARAMAAAPARQRRPILFAAVTAEEDGLLGARYLAANPVTGAGRIVASVNLDMPLLLHDFTDIAMLGADRSTLGPLATEAVTAMGIAVSPDPLPRERLFLRSDHFAFVERGVPALFLLTGFANGGEAAYRDFLALHYHKPSDEADLPINWNAAGRFARLTWRIVRTVADADQAPLWYRGDPYGETYAPDMPKAKRR